MKININSKILFLTLLGLVMSGCNRHKQANVEPLAPIPPAKAQMKRATIHYTKKRDALTKIQRKQLLYFLKSQPVAEIHLAECRYDDLSESKNSHRMSLLVDELYIRGYKNVTVDRPISSRRGSAPCIELSAITLKFTDTDCDSLVYNAPYTDSFTCATQRNLKLMLAHKSDLHAHKELKSFNGDVVSSAVERYQKGENTGASSNNSNGSVSAITSTSTATGGRY